MEQIVWCGGIARSGVGEMGSSVVMLVLWERICRP